MVRTAAIFIAILLSLAQSAPAQQTDPASTITIEPYILPKNVSTIFENDSFIVLTSTELLNNYYKPEDTLTGKKHEYRLWKMCYSTEDTVNYYSCAAQKNLDHLVVYRAAVLMSESQCTIICKQTGTNVGAVQVQMYDHVGCGGHAYYIDGHLLFETIEWIY